MLSEGVPYSPAMIGKILRAMTDDELEAIKPEYFQLAHIRRIVKGSAIRELIANEKSRRMR